MGLIEPLPISAAALPSGVLPLDSSLLLWVPLVCARSGSRPQTSGLRLQEKIPDPSPKPEVRGPMPGH
jgi:hypothetical protein